MCRAVFSRYGRLWSSLVRNEELIRTEIVNKIVCALLAFVGWVGAVASECTLAPGRLRVEHLENPPLVDVDIPRFSWVDNPSDPLAKGLSQSGYRIVVSSSAERLASGDYDVWDSGKVKSARSYLVGYGGSPLSPGGKFHQGIGEG